LEVLILLFGHNLARHCLIHGGLTLIQLLQGLEVLLLMLPQILLEDGMVLLEFGVLGLQALELLRELGEPSLSAVPSHGGLGNLVLHHRRVLDNGEEDLILFGNSLLELGVFLFNLDKFLP
jgi:hypothetical protein